MKTSNFYFSTPLVNQECPYGMKNPNVAVTQKAAWDRSQTFEEDRDLNQWMQKQGFGELMPNFYQADSPELMSCEAVKNFLTAKGMIHNPALDPDLEDSFEC